MMNRHKQMKSTGSGRPAGTIQPCATQNHPRTGDWMIALLVGGLAGLLGVLSAGCSTGQPASASFASVVISNQSLETIHDTTVQVFEEAGFKVKRVPKGSMVFEKEGSRGDQFIYGSVGGAAYGGAVTVRVKAEIVDLVDQDAYRLQCTAYMVNDAGEGVFEDSQRLANYRRGPYQKLLDEVAAKLKVK